MCEFASNTDERGDLLLCGYSAQKAWEQTWIRKDIKDQIYKFAERRQVHFRGGGASPGGRHIVWNCTKDLDGLQCK